VDQSLTLRQWWSSVEAGGGMVPLRDFEDGETAWIVVRDGNTMATREIRPMDVVLAEVVVSDAVGPFSIRDRRQFIAPWIPKEELLSGGSLGGDVMGPLDDNRVMGLRGRPISDIEPSNGDVLTWDGGSGSWGPSPIVLSGEATGPVNNTSVPLSGDVTGTASNTSVVGLRGRSIADAVPNHNHALVWDSTQNAWKPSFVSISGDVSGDTSNSLVVGLRGRPIANVDPNNNDVLTWDATMGAWKPAPPPSGGGGGSGIDPGPWALRGLYAPQFPNTSMFTIRVGYSNEVFQNTEGGRGILFARTSNAGGNGGIWRLKPLPPLPVRIICGFSDVSILRSYMNIGIIMYHEPTGRGISADFHANGGPQIVRWNNYASANSVPFNESNSRHRHSILIGFDITTSGYTYLYFPIYGYSISVFSEDWWFMGSPPTHIGLISAHWGESGVGWFWHWEEIPL